MNDFSSPARRFQGKGDLTKGPVGRHLVRLTLPMVWGLFAVISFGIVDAFYIGLLGTRELAAISFTFPVTYTIFNITIGMAIATTSVLSRQIGRGNMPRVRRLATHAVILAVIMGLMLALAGAVFHDALFRAMGAPEDMIPLIRGYMMIWFAGSVFINFPVVGNAAMRAAGDSFTPAMIMTVAAVANAILDPIMIFGLFGFPRMEMRGAALSTVLANMCAMTAGLYVIGVRKGMMTRSRRHWRLFSDSARRLLHIALPAGLTGTIMPLTTAALTALLATHGTEAVAAFGLVSRVEGFAFITIIALATAMAPIIGQNWGAGHIDRVHLALRYAFIFAAAWSSFIALILFALARPIADLFTNDPKVIALAALYFMTVPPTAVIGNLVQGWGSAFNAMGMPKRSVAMIVIKLVLIMLPLAFIGSRLYGVPGIFGALALTNLATGLWFHVRNTRLLPSLHPSHGQERGKVSMTQ